MVKNLPLFCSPMMVIRVQYKDQNPSPDFLIQYNETDLTMGRGAGNDYDNTKILTSIFLVHLGYCFTGSYKWRYFRCSCSEKRKIEYFMQSINILHFEIRPQEKVQDIKSCMMCRVSEEVVEGERCPLTHSWWDTEYRCSNYFWKVLNTSLKFCEV